MEKVVYEAVDRGNAYYAERIDRNIGWILPHEQEILRQSVVGVAGNGGMGGLLSAVLVRAGIGEVRIADREVFDISNMNRQFAARRTTVGKSKAFETAKELLRITDDVRIVVYPEGISEATVDDFVSGCDLVLDEIEFFAVSARILLHERARAQNVSLMNANTVGFSTRLFFYTPRSVTMEETLGLTYEAACALEQSARGGSDEARRDIIDRILTGLVPELPQYKCDDKHLLLARLLEEGKASIIATNPPMATGFLADRILLHLLRDSGVERVIVSTPEMPDCLFMDAAKLEAGVIHGPWWSWDLHKITS